MERHRAGFSLIEALIAIALLFFIAVMILPLLNRSMSLNASGRSSTSAANFARGTLEDYSRLGFEHERLTLTGGDELVTRELWLPTAESAVGRWVSEAEGSGEVTPWAREVEVRQYSIADLSNDLLDDQDLDDPLPEGTDPIQVHLKEVLVSIEPTQTTIGPLGAGSRVVVRTLKAF